MAPGPKGKPAAKKRLEGNPGQRPIPENFVEPTGDATCPDHLNGYAVTVWGRVMASMPAGVYTASDIELLAAYCMACAELKRAYAHLEVEGRVVHVQTKWGTTPRRNPWSAIAAESTRQITTLGSQLGLDPMSREKIKAPDARVPKKFGRLVGIDGGKAG